MDGLDIFYIAFAAAWTVAIVAGAAVLVRNRAEHCVRIRNLPLALSAVACLHVFWMLALLVRPIRDRYSCATEYWIMSVYLPLGVALFQATSMQLLSVAGLQSAILLVDQHHSPRKLPARLVPRLLFRWRSMTLLKRTELGIAIGMVLQLLISTSVFLASRKFHSFGTFSHPTTPAECRRGTEWIPSIIWQFTWAWLFAPYVLWKIRNIRDIHYWRIQTTVCVIAAWASINYYWAPSLWFTPGILMMEAVTIFIPCYEIMCMIKRRRYIHKVMNDWERKRNRGNESAKQSLRSEAYSRSSFDKYMTGDFTKLLYYASLREFSGENIEFLRTVNEWKASWNKIEPAYDWDADPNRYRLQLFKAAVEIYVRLVDLRTAKVAVNLDGHITAPLKKLFGAVADAHARPDAAANVATPFAFPDPDDSGSVVEFASRGHKGVFGSTRSSQDDLYGGAAFDRSEVPDDVAVPAGFDCHVYDRAFESIKYIVYTNTWPKFVDFASDNKLGELEKGR